MLHIAVGIWLLVMALFAGARQPADLYTSRTLVLDQSSPVRERAAADALAEVFVRISGSREIVQSAAIRQALTNATTYLYEFEYSSTDETLKTTNGEQAAIRLSMKFSARRVDNLLKSEQLPYWPANRPDILLWAAHSDGAGGQQFIANDAAAVAAFTRTATERGIPLVKPVFDLEDRLALPVSRLWALDTTAINRASDRYRTDAVLAGRFILLEQGRWRGSFTLFYRSQATVFVAHDNNTAALAVQLIDQVADHFAAMFTSAVDGHSDADRLVLTVANVDSFAIYVQLLNYLEDLSMVQEVSLVEVAADKVTIALRYQGDRALVSRRFTLDRQLIDIDSQRVTGPAPGESVAIGRGTASHPLQFFWQPK